MNPANFSPAAEFSRSNMARECVHGARLADWECFRLGERYLLKTQSVTKFAQGVKLRFSVSRGSIG